MTNFSPEKPEISSGEELQEQTPSANLDKLRDQALKLKARVEEAKKRKEKETEQKANDLETLYGEGREIDEQFVIAQEISQSYEEAIALADDAGIEVSSGDNQGHEDAKQLVISLSESRDKIIAQIDVLSRQPEVMEVVEGHAKKEDAQREVEKIEQQTTEELLPEVDELCNSIRVTMVADFKRAMQKVDELSQQVDEAQAELRNLKNKINGLAPEYIRNIEEFHGKKTSLEDIRQFFEQERERTGLFDKKKKRAIDLVLSSPSLVSNETYEKYISAHTHLFSDEWEPYERVISQFEGLMSKAENAEEQIDKMLETERHYPQRILDKIHRKLMEVLEEEGVIRARDLKNHFIHRRFSS